MTRHWGIYDTVAGELRHSMDGFMTQAGLWDWAAGGWRMPRAVLEKHP